VKIPATFSDEKGNATSDRGVMSFAYTAIPKFFMFRGRFLIFSITADLKPHF
jgi:hypothetical protein